MNLLRNPLFGLVCLVLLFSLSSPETLAQTPTLVSVARNDVKSGGTQSNDPVLSANGRFVAFESSAFNLVANDNNGSSDIFVRDLQTGTTTLVSINIAGTGSGNGHSTKPTISADGRYVAFQSRANNLVANDTNTWTDTFVRDLQTNSTKLLSTNSAGTGSGNQDSENAVISANGKTVVFKSFATNIVSFDNNNRVDVFAHDVPTGITRIISCDVACTAPGNDDSYTSNVPKDKAPRALISKDGRFVVFESRATNLVATPDANGSPDVFVRDLETAVTTLVSINSAGNASSNGGGNTPVISGNGRFVFFQTGATDLSPNDSALAGDDLYVRDLQTNTTQLVTVTTTNTGSNVHAAIFFPVASDDGRYVTFQSRANTYVTDDADSTIDVFRRDLQTNTTVLVSVNVSPPPSNGDNEAAAAVMSADGRFVSFLGFGPAFSPITDNNHRGDVFVRDVNAGTTAALTIKLDGTSTANFGGEYPGISADGRIVLFESSSTDMVTNEIFAINLFATAINTRAKLAISPLTVDETAGQASVTVTRTGNTSDVLNLQYATSQGTAAATTDYTSISGSLNFAAGEVTKNIAIPIVNDSMDEADESLLLIVSDFATGSTVGTLSSQIVTIVDDDPLPSLDVADVTVIEGNTGSTLVAFTATLSAPSGRSVIFAASTASGTASSGSDFHGFSLTNITIPAGTLSHQLMVVIVGDRIFEDDETVLLNLSAPFNVMLARTQAVMTIQNDDPQPTISISDRTLSEGAPQMGMHFFVQLTNPSSKTITVQYATADGTAKADSDYVAQSGTLTFLPGVQAVIITVQQIKDAVVETDENFFINLSNASQATINDAQGAGNILNDDFPVLLLEEGSQDAAALDAILWLSGPFPLVRPFNFGTDIRTRVSLFASNVELVAGENQSAVTVSAEDEIGGTYELAVEYVGPIAGVNGVSQIIVRLPDTVGNARELRVKVKLRGQSSNVAAIEIAP